MKLKMKHLKGDFKSLNIDCLGNATPEQLKEVFKVAPNLFETKTSKQKAAKKLDDIQK